LGHLLFHVTLTMMNFAHKWNKYEWNTDSLWNLYKLQQEFLSISKLCLVSIKGTQHLQLIYLWQDLEQAPQLLGPNVIVLPIPDELNDVLVGAAQTQLVAGFSEKIT
jgi:hypothetical protein